MKKRLKKKLKKRFSGSHLREHIKAYITAFRDPLSGIEHYHGLVKTSQNKDE